jgi:cytochrome b561
MGTTTLAAATGYAPLAKWFHWITAALILAALPTGFVIKYIAETDDGIHKMAFYGLHESLGVTIFLVALARLAWRLTHPAPPAPAGRPRLLQGVATGLHHAAYALLILQPVLGFLATNAWGFPLQGQTAYLGLIDQPKFMAANEGLAGVLQGLHSLGGWLLLVFVVLHLGAVVLHQAIRRDGTLLRMI